MTRLALPSLTGKEPGGASSINLLAQCRAQAHEDAALHLGQQVVRIQDLAALEDLAHAPHFEPALLGINAHFNAGRDVGALFGAAG